MAATSPSRGRRPRRPVPVRHAVAFRREEMKIRFGVSVAFAACMSVTTALAQNTPADKIVPDSYEGHLAAAKKAAGPDFLGTLPRLCLVPSFSGGAPSNAADKSTWY